MIRLTRNSLLAGLLAATCIGLSLPPEIEGKDATRTFAGLASSAPDDDGSGLDMMATGSIIPAGLLPPARPKPGDGSPPVAVASAANGPDSVDLAAIYYYADERQDDRVQAELARLQLKYPDFQLPKDLYAPRAQRNVDESALWALYETGDFAGIDAETGRMRAEHPGWSPSADFSGKLARRKARVLMTRAYEAKDWAGVLDAASALDATTETEADLLWMSLDACRQTGRTDRLAEIYRGILFRDGDRRMSDDILVTTLQKAVQDFSGAEIRAAIRTLWARPESVTGLAGIDDDVLRAEVAAFNAKDASTTPPGMDVLARMKALAAASGKGEDHALLGWSYLKLGQAKEAEAQFSAALATGPQAGFAKGLYLSLATQDRDEEAYAVAAKYLTELSDDPEFLMNALSVRFAKPDLGDIDAKSVEAYSSTIVETKSAGHAEILAWYAYNSRQFEAAEAWFEKALEWEPAAARLTGLALSYMRQNKKKELSSLREENAADYPEIFRELATAAPPRGKTGATVAKPSGAGQADYAASLGARRYSDCIRQLQTVEARGGLTANAQLIRGWCQMGLNRLSEARGAFQAALSGTGQVREDAAYGLALASLRGNLTDDADAMLTAYPMSAARTKEIRVEVLWQRARGAFDQKQYQHALEALNARLQIMPEPTDLSVLRAWAHFNLGHKAEARAIFERLNMRMSDPEVTKGLRAVKEATR